MQSENLSFAENPRLMDTLSHIYLSAKRQGVICEIKGMKDEDAARIGMDDGWFAAQAAYQDKGSEYQFNVSDSWETDDLSSEQATGMDERLTDILEEMDDFSEEPEERDIPENIDADSDEWLIDDKLAEPEQKEVTWDYLRGFLAGYADYLHEQGISLGDNEELKMHLRASFVRAMDASDDMFNPLRKDAKDSFYPGVLDGKRCATIDLERISQEWNTNPCQSGQTDKESDILCRTC